MIIDKEIEQKIMNVSSPKEYAVRLVPRKEISELIETWHYSQSINGLQSEYCFGLYYEDKETNAEYLIGAMIYGKLGMANVWKKYADKPEDLLELRRLALIDNTVGNSESYFIGSSIRWLIKNTDVKTIISYADTYYGHQGIVYQASNFELIGQTSVGRKISYDGKLYHDKAIRTKYKGQLKPFAQRLKTALENGKAEYISMPAKNIYIYNLENKRK